MNLILAIDGGGSRTRCLAIDRHGQVLGHAQGGPSNHLLVAADVVRRSLTETINQTLTSGGLNHGDVVCVSAGLAGVDFDGVGAPAMEELLSELGFDHAVVNGDMVVAHCGALVMQEGVVALAGTGSAILGVGSNGERVKVGGWGPVYGDEGSAYRIGQMSLRAAARDYDGRGPATELKQALLNFLGISEFRETVARVYVKGMEPRQIAALSSVAYETAVAGDEVARAIFLTAAEELAEGVETAIRQLGLGAETRVSYQGAVLETCALVRDRFEEVLGGRFPGISIVAPKFEPVIGAYLLGRKALDWATDESVVNTLECSFASRV
jgi:N-acetylglucosamine kinase-like BadF-type ATPase